MACQQKSQRMGFPSLLQDPPPTPDPLPAGCPPKSGMKQFCARHPSHKLLAPHAVVTTGYAPPGRRSQNCGSTALPPHWSQEFSLLEMWRGRERRKGNLSLYHSSYIYYVKEKLLCSSHWSGRGGIHTVAVCIDTVPIPSGYEAPC